MSVNNGMRPVHPGEILGEELEELGMSVDALANALDIPADRLQRSWRESVGYPLTQRCACLVTWAPHPNYG